MPAVGAAGAGCSLLFFPQGVLLRLEDGLEQVVQDGFLAREDIHRRHHAGKDGQLLVAVLIGLIQSRFLVLSGIFDLGKSFLDLVCRGLDVLY